MIPVESSNIAAIGFENGTMRVEFRDGGVYEYPDTTVEQHASVMGAKSKGRALNALLTMRAGVVMKSQKPTVTAGGPIHATQAEGCCKMQLSNASLSGKLDKLDPFECPRCGTLYQPKAIGPLVSWEAKVEILIIRPRR